MRAETLTEQLFFTTVRLEVQKVSGLEVGTGFVVAVETPRGTLHSLVTNRHVLRGARTLTVRMVGRDGDAPLLGQASEITIRDFDEDAWVGHADPEIDVAVMPLASVIDEMVRVGAPPFFRAVTPELFAGADLLSSLDAVEEVTFVGYPNGLFDTANFLPIARRGTTATPVEVDYQGRPTFLIDAAVFPGSSGSPVFLLNRGMFQDRSGDTMVGSRFAFLGIVAAVHVRRVNGSVVEVISGFRASFDEPIGLGVVYRAETILQCIDQLLTAIGLHRIDAAPSARPGEITAVDEEVADEASG